MNENSKFHPLPMPKKLKKKRRSRVPQIIWQIFQNRARTLFDTVLSLLPPCRCKRRRRCLSCAGEDFLSRSEDPYDYKKLLSECFVVIDHNAPPFPPSFDPHPRWSQPEIVRRSIEMMLYDQPSSTNLICSDYDKVNRSSAVVDALTCSNWSLLLSRVGDALMMYLLKYTSIFVPLPRKKHHQITGFPVSSLLLPFSKRMPSSIPRQHQVAYNKSGKKRKRVEGVESVSEEQLHTFSIGLEFSSTSNTCVGSNGSSCMTSEELSPQKCDGNSDQYNISSGKRTRQYRWQRQRKRRELIAQGTCFLIPCRANSESDNLSRGLQHGSVASACQRHVINTLHCFCCSVFQNVAKMNRNAEIDRRNIFYKFDNSSPMFPRMHKLYSLKPNDSGAADLFKNIFGTSGFDMDPHTRAFVHSEDGCLTKSTCLYHSLTKLLKRLIRGSQNCQYLRLLNKHCSTKSSSQDAGGGTVSKIYGSGTNLYSSGQDGVEIEGKPFLVASAENNKSISEATVDRSCCQKKDVVAFIWAVCRRIVPSPLLGEPCNWRTLRRNISKFIHLRRFEKFSLKQCIHKLKISKFPLLSNKECITDIARHTILERWIFWLFARVISPLLQANFYVTESEHEKQEVLYYRKSTWEKLMSETEDSLKKKRYRLLNNSSARKILGNRSFGFSRARLRPKQIGFRVLTNLRAPSRMPVDQPSSRVHSNPMFYRNTCSQPRNVKYQYLKSANTVLHDYHVALKGICTKEPEKLGSSVFDYNDVYRKLVPFLSLLKGAFTSMPGVYIVVSDVSKAFDSVDQQKLLSVMNDIILDDEYTLEKFIHVIRTKASLKVHHHLTLAHPDIIADSAKIKSQLPSQPSDSVLVKKASSRIIGKKEFNSILREHITRNVVHLNNDFYLQRVGIPQGSVLSALLCSFYYGHMERNVVIPFIQKACEEYSRDYDNEDASALWGGNHAQENSERSSQYLLLRFIDDFLFISTSKKQASMFFSRLQRGVRDYNCSMNEEKYGLNFQMNEGQGCQSNRLHVSRDGISFLHWSGLLLNCRTLEIQADYTRYMNSHLSSSLTVSCQGKVSRQLKMKLRTYLRPKCHPIFYDSKINSPGVVRLNIYQVFLLCAMKFLCYIANLSVLPQFSPNFYMDAIDSSLRYMSRLIKRKMYCLEVDNAFRPKYDVKNKDVVWLGLYAYSRAVKKKQSRCKGLLRLLRSKLKAYGKLETISPELRYAVDDAHSSVLWSIKY